MAKFTKGQKVMKEGNECYYIDGKVVEFVSRKGWDRDSAIPDDYTSIGNNTYHYAKDKDLELIIDYQPILPKVGERYRVLKQNKVYLQATPGRIITLLEDDKSNLPYRWSFSDDQSTRHMNRCDFVTTEYLELDEA